MLFSWSYFWFTFFITVSPWHAVRQFPFFFLIICGVFFSPESEKLFLNILKFNTLQCVHHITQHPFLISHHNLSPAPYVVFHEYVSSPFYYYYSFALISYAFDIVTPTLHNNIIYCYINGPRTVSNNNNNYYYSIPEYFEKITSTHKIGFRVLTFFKCKHAFNSTNIRCFIWIDLGRVNILNKKNNWHLMLNLEKQQSSF